jgi:hypothetical protein
MWSPKGRGRGRRGNDELTQYHQPHIPAPTNARLPTNIPSLPATPADASHMIMKGMRARPVTLTLTAWWCSHSNSMARKHGCTSSAKSLLMGELVHLAPKRSVWHMTDRLAR